MNSNARRLTAVHDGQVHTRDTHRNYTHVVIYGDGRRPTWHSTREAAEKHATRCIDVVVLVQEA